MENSSFDIEAIEIPTPISVTFENRCHNCKKKIVSTDYSYNYCPYCGASTVSAKRYQEFLESIIEETIKDNISTLSSAPPMTFGYPCYNCKKVLRPEDFKDKHCPYCGVSI